MTDEAMIRELVTGWARAVHTGDLNGVLANHDSDIVMFDVPPPFDGVRASTRTGTAGRRSSNGSDRAPSSRSWSST